MGEFEKKIMQEDLIINYHYGPMYKYGKEVPREYDDELHFESAISKEDVMDIIEEAKKEFPPYPEVRGQSMEHMYDKESWNKMIKQFALEANEWFEKWFGQ